MRHTRVAVDRLGILEERFDGDGRRNFSCVNERRQRFINACVQRIVKMPRLQKAGNAVQALVVDQDRAQERLFGLQVVRRLAEVERFVG